MNSGFYATAVDDVVSGDLTQLTSSLHDVFRSMAGRRLLITGGAGFLGYYLVQAVLAWNRDHGSEEPIQLTVLDNYLRGVPSWLTELADDPALQLVTHNIIDPLPGEMGHFDYVVHAAGIASPTYYRQHPLETMDANIHGLRLLLEHARRQQDRGLPLAGMLFFSSSEIYGDPLPEWVPTPEHYRGHVSCTGPRACYDESKRYGETLCTVFAHKYGVPVCMVRPFNNYGPGLKITDRRVLPDFCRDVLAGRPITLLSNGAPRRTFCYVADAVTGYYLALAKGRPGEPYNIGTQQPEISMRELAERVAEAARELFGYQAGVEHGASEETDYLVDNPERRCPDIAKARRELGYEPRVDLKDGLRRSLLWYAKNRDAENR